MPTTLPAPIRDYLRTFRLVAICIDHDGHIIGVARDPVGAAWWWAEGRTAGRIVRLAEANGLDVPAAASALGVRVSPHEVVVSRAQACVTRIDAGIDRAQAKGDLKTFNAVYRARRLAARARGEHFMSYPQAQGRLRRALARRAAGDMAPSVIAEVFR